MARVSHQRYLIYASSKVHLAVLIAERYLNRRGCFAGAKIGKIGNGSCILLSSQAALLGDEKDCHVVKCVDDKLAEALFCKHAFQCESSQRPCFHSIISSVSNLWKRAGSVLAAKDPDDSLPWREIVKHCFGLPLALRVTGASLVDKNRKEWDSTEEYLKKLSPEDVHGRLKISYKLLPKNAKWAFVVRYRKTSLVPAFAPSVFLNILPDNLYAA